MCDCLCTLSEAVSWKLIKIIIKSVSLLIQSYWKLDSLCCAFAWKKASKSSTRRREWKNQCVLGWDAVVWSDVVLVLLLSFIFRVTVWCNVTAHLILWLKCCFPKLFVVENVAVAPAIPSVVVVEGPCRAPENWLWNGAQLRACFSAVSIEPYSEFLW